MAVDSSINGVEGVDTARLDAGCMIQEALLNIAIDAVDIYIY